MTMTQNLSEIVVTTLESRTGKLADNVTDNNALLTRLNTRGNIDFVSGGSEILQELEYAENGTAMYYSGYETLDLTPQRVMDAARFSFKQAAVGVSISGLEELQNDGEERVISLLKSRIGNAERTMKNLISSGIYSDGTGSGGKQIGGLQFLVSSTPTSGTVGGFDRSSSSNSWWRNQTTTFSALSLTAGSDTIQSAMNNLYMKTHRGNDNTDLIVADNVYFTYYLESLQALVRIQDTNSDIGKLGFQNLKFMNGTDVVLDGGIGGNMPASTMYFLNTDYIHYRPHIRRNMVVDQSERKPLNQDAMCRLILWAGNMTLSNAQLQGVLTAS
jgi:hypothetical protein